MHISKPPCQPPSLWAATTEKTQGFWGNYWKNTCMCVHMYTPRSGMESTWRQRGRNGKDGGNVCEQNNLQLVLAWQTCLYMIVNTFVDVGDLHLYVRT